MPRAFTAYEPSQLDCNTMVTALGEDFSVLPEITVRFERDKVLTVCKCYHLAQDKDDGPQVQALHRRALKGTYSAWIGVYAVLLDCWHQLDRGTLAVAEAPVTRGWNGRPQAPRRRNAQ